MIACVLAVSCACASSSDVTVRLSVNIDSVEKEISSHLVGIFFEDLNYAADGGLYAELIQNRSFEYSPTERTEWGPLSFWELQKRGAADGYLRVGEVRPVHVNNPHYCILTVTETGDGVGIVNSGFDGIPVDAGASYRASFWAYQPFMNRQWGPENGIEDRPMPVTLQLVNPEGDIIAEQSLEIAGRAWKKYEVTLTAKDTVSNAQFVLVAQAKGGVALDMISLFPTDTFRGHKNGLRKDLAQTIANIEPKFMRFPGGCLVHGQGIHSYYDWKNSVGPIEQRKGQRNLWGYHQTLGMGYFEFFQFCEDMNALPLPVVSAGVCCQHGGDTPNRGQEGLPIDEMPAYIQDILDLIEWANGPSDSRWGKIRAAAGHPEPFGLQYLGVGNEDSITPEFRERFSMINEVLKSQHPEITIVGTVGPFASGEDFDNGWEFAKELQLSMVDEHYYVPPQWFWDNLHRYDSYDRNGPKIYVGEYAAHDVDRKNTLRSALAESAGMVGFERNGDVVQFSSYAPLLSRRGNTQWTPDLIYFDATHVYPSANYYAQMLFGQNSGDLLYESILSDNAPSTLVTSAVTDSESNDFILKIVNGGDSPQKMDVNIIGLPISQQSKTVKTVLSGSSADAINEDGKDVAVYPVTELIDLENSFSYIAPANSLTVLRFHRE